MRRTFFVGLIVVTLELVFTRFSFVVGFAVVVLTIAVAADVMACDGFEVSFVAPTTYFCTIKVFDPFLDRLSDCENKTDKRTRRAKTLLILNCGATIPEKASYDVVKYLLILWGFRFSIHEIHCS